MEYSFRKFENLSRTIRPSASLRPTARSGRPVGQNAAAGHESAAWNAIDLAYFLSGKRCR
jgi:hypothetical protein